MLTYDLTQRQERPLYEHLYLCMRKDIERGIIAPDQKLPSKRGLAKHLGVSVITVEGAYAQLVAEGYVRAVERKGYYACDLLGARRLHVGGGGSLYADDASGHVGKITEDYGQASVDVLVENPADGYGETAAVSRSARPSSDLFANREDDADASQGAKLIADFRNGTASAGLFPYDGWAKALRQALAEESESTLTSASHFQGSLRLRHAICRYLKGVRGMDVSPDQVLIGAGSQYLYHQLVQLLGRGRTVALENPGYPRLAKIYGSNGMNVQPVSMDGQGIDVVALRASGADLVHVTPSHQYPTGQVTSISRRYELLAWAAEKDDRVIIEDDYDCEFRFAGKPIPALQSIDASQQVIYANTFSKSLGSGFRIGYLVLPDRFAKQYREELSFYSCTVSAIDQLALARFMECGSYERHVSRMRIHYRNVRNRLLHALEESSIADRLEFFAIDAGLHFLMGVKSVRGADELADACLRQGVALLPLGYFMLGEENAVAGSSHPFGSEERESSQTAWFMMNYAGLQAERIPDAVAAIERALRE